MARAYAPGVGGRRGRRTVHEARRPAHGTHLGFGRIVVSEIEVPNILVNLAWYDVDERWCKANMRPSPARTTLPDAVGVEIRTPPSAASSRAVQPVSTSPLHRITTIHLELSAPFL